MKYFAALLLLLLVGCDPPNFPGPSSKLEKFPTDSRLKPFEILSFSAHGRTYHLIKDEREGEYYLAPEGGGIVKLERPKKE